MPVAYFLDKDFHFLFSKKIVSKNLDILVLSGRNFDFKFNLDSENETTINWHTVVCLVFLLLQVSYLF